MYFFCADLHGITEKYHRLFRFIEAETPSAVFLGGDLLPHQHFSGKQYHSQETFLKKFLAVNIFKIKEKLGQKFPKIFLILGNDDSRIVESSVIELAKSGIWDYIHFRKVIFEGYSVYGYSYVPPTPFLLKDWERYDVSRYVDPGCISPEEGYHSLPISEADKQYATIQKDLQKLAKNEGQKKSIYLFHSPPHRTKLDRAALDGQIINHVPVDVHVGSIAIRKFIEQAQPHITLHGHVHESSTLTGAWREKMGNTYAFTAAYDGSELAVIKFEPSHPNQASRELLL